MCAANGAMGLSNGITNGIMSYYGSRAQSYTNMANAY
jgi:hypothetical protein